ncbi:MAG: protein translocase subunit SecF [Spirochaetia bacterium]
MKVIHFTKIRILMFVLSAIVIAGGIFGVVMQGGFNLGIDFQSGLNLRLQIAQPAVELTYDGDGSVLVDSNNLGFLLTLRRDDGTRESYDLRFEEYETVSEMADAFEQAPGVEANVLESGSLNSELLISLNAAENLSDVPLVINLSNVSEDSIVAGIEEMRAALEGIQRYQIQIVGEPANQEYAIRLEETGEDDFSQVAPQRVEQRLEDAFGENTVVLRQSDYVGPAFSQDLVSQTVFLTLMALALILVYVWMRFRLGYAVAAICALIHDVLIMFGVIGTFQLEVSTSTIAAVLTIIGYSLNDTIVVFDRIRENNHLMRDSKLPLIVNTSITQSLSRTLITSLTTLLGVVAIYIFGTGQIQLFALNLIIGILVGTYSSIFIASPIYFGWMQKARKNRYKGIEKEPETSSSGEAGAAEPKKKRTIEVVEDRTKKRGKKSRKDRKRS